MNNDIHSFCFVVGWMHCLYTNLAISISNVGLSSLSFEAQGHLVFFW